MSRKKKVGIAVVAGTLVLAVGAIATTKMLNAKAAAPALNAEYQQRFEELYADIMDPNNGYFNEQGIPYHSVETLMVEAPDQGHESTSEAASYLLWLQAMNGKMTGNFDGVNEAWDIIEKYFIPTDADQPGQGSYNANAPATLADEFPLPNYYPSELKFDQSVGYDPLYNELQSTYGKSQIYGMHWLIDVDNFYGYGQRGDGTSTPSYINTYQRGQQESVWETIPHPSWEDFSWGGQNGFLDLFTGDANYSKQWRYTIASDADARCIQVMYDAAKYAKEYGVNLDSAVEKASKMGDYLRYSMFDKYFMEIGAQGKTPATDGEKSQHYLLSWYYSWGGALDGSWCWRIGCSHSHFGYQNPYAAWILSENDEFVPKSPTAQDDWSQSLDRQLELYTWLQSSEGAIAGGCTNSYNGDYSAYPSGTSTFYGMAYDADPVYEDPGSNQWSGMQGWSMQRIAELYYETNNATAKALLDKWSNWAVSNIKLNADGTFAVPSTLAWSGQPDTWTGKASSNNNLHCTVVDWGTDLGVSASFANTLTYYAAAVQKYEPNGDYKTAANCAKELLDRMWTLYRDDIGVATVEVRNDYARLFEQEVYVPSSYSGKMANGDEIKSGVKFIDIRTNYENDPDYARVKAAYEKGEDITFTYHRFWAQAEIAIANGTFAMLFPSGIDGTSATTAPTATTRPTATATATATTRPTATATATATVRPTATVTVAPTATVAPAGNINVTVSSQGGATTNTLGGQFKVTATSGSFDLSKLEIRYYFTADDSTASVAYRDSAALTVSRAPWYIDLTSSTTASVVKMSSTTATADSYLSVTFNSSEVLDSTGTLQFGVRVSKTTWANFTQTNDYSYLNGAVVLYDGVVVAGTLPN